VSAKGSLVVSNQDGSAVDPSKELTKDATVSLKVHTMDTAGREADLVLDLTTKLANLDGTLIAKGIP
jgi:hypothetical protein